MNPKRMLFTVIPILLLLFLAWHRWPAKPLPAGTHIDSLVVYKSKRQLLAFAQGTCVKTYTIALGQDPIGHKVFEGDMKTPEGHYTINARNAHSAYHKNLGISYPNDNDRAAAAALGKSPGGNIKIHGLRNGRGWIGKCHRWKDWTHGCIAVTNAEIDELFDAVLPDAPIHILP